MQLIRRYLSWSLVMAALTISLLTTSCFRYHDRDDDHDRHIRRAPYPSHVDRDDRDHDRDRDRDHHDRDRDHDDHYR